MSWDDVIRGINALLAFTALMLLFSVSRPRWKTYTPKMKDYVIALGGFLFLAIEANLEILLGLQTRGPRVIIQFGILIFTIRGLLRKDQGYTLDNLSSDSSRK